MSEWDKVLDIWVEMICEDKRTDEEKLQDLYSVFFPKVNS